MPDPNSVDPNDWAQGASSGLPPRLLPTGSHAQVGAAHAERMRQEAASAKDASDRAFAQRISATTPAWSPTNSNAFSNSSASEQGSDPGSAFLGLLVLLGIVCVAGYFSFIYLQNKVYETFISKEERFKRETGCTYFPQGNIYKAQIFKWDGLFLSAADKNFILGPLNQSGMAVFDVIGSCEANRVAVTYVRNQNNAGSASNGVAVTDGSNLIWAGAWAGGGLEHPIGTTVHSESEKNLIVAPERFINVDECRRWTKLKDKSPYAYHNYLGYCQPRQ
jgi:hypothetical protein